MKPTVKKYENDKELETDINALKEHGIGTKDIYVLSHDPDRTSRIVKNTEVIGVDYNQSETKQSYDKQGDELRAKLKSLNIPENEASDYEEEMNEGKIFLIVTDERVKGEL
ncbi:general stress protein [Staphylococcus saprophyticus]|uniref:general stress protein n=1 Tax=Staphylococcus saprophyticus TaxID=29385 RepID=UPI0019D0D1F7|nr:general stress protein [Staphylococcus saprophyticus]